MYLVDGGTALAVQCVVGDARVGAVPAPGAAAGMEEKAESAESAESVQAETGVLRRPRKSWTLKWRITSAAAVGMPSQRAIATAKLRRCSLPRTIST